MAYKYVETKDKVYAKAYKVYSGAVPTTINIHSKYPSIDYTKLTNRDFIPSYKSDNGLTLGAYQSGSASTDSCDIRAYGVYVYCSYNASNGNLYIGVSNSTACGYNTPDKNGGKDWYTKSFSGLTGEVMMIVDGVSTEY